MVTIGKCCDIVRRYVAIPDCVTLDISKLPISCCTHGLVEKWPDHALAIPWRRSDDFPQNGAYADLKVLQDAILSTKPHNPQSVHEIHGFHGLSMDFGELSAYFYQKRKF